jgi:hypothetical protein
MSWRILVIAICVLLLAGCSTPGRGHSALDQPLKVQVKVVEITEIKRDGDTRQQKWASSVYGAAGYLVATLMDGSLRSLHKYQTVDAEDVERAFLARARALMDVERCYLIEIKTSCYKACEVGADADIAAALPCDEALKPRVKAPTPPVDTSQKEKTSFRPN